MGWTVRESNFVVIFCTRPDWPWEPPSLLYNLYRFSFLEVKQPGRGVDHTSISSTDIPEAMVWSLAAVAGKWTARACLLIFFHVLIFVYGTHLLSFIQSTSGFSGWPKPGAGGSFYSYLTPGRLRRRQWYVVRQSFVFGLLHFKIGITTIFVTIPDVCLADASGGAGSRLPPRK